MTMSPALVVQAVCRRARAVGVKSFRASSAALATLALASCGTFEGEGAFSPGPNPAAAQWMATKVGQPVDDFERLTAVMATAMVRACPSMLAISRETVERHRAAMVVANQKEGEANVQRQIANLINSTRATGCAQNAADIVGSPERFPFLTARARAG
jgi:hypothetical protein